MPPTDQPADNGDDFDPTTMLWSPGIDYIRGWREASDAAAELLDALRAAGIDTTSITARADTLPDGTGLIRTALPASAVHQMTAMLRRSTTHICRTSA